MGGVHIGENNKRCFGISSICEDGNHVFMSDIDIKKLGYSRIRKINSELFKYNIRTIFWIKSTNGYNILSLDKMPLTLIHMINEQLVEVDKKYNDINFKRGYYTMRIGEDKHIINRIFERPIFVLSNAHRRFLWEMFNLVIPTNKYFDNGFRTHIVGYNSCKYGFIEVNNEDNR